MITKSEFDILMAVHEKHSFDGNADALVEKGLIVKSETGLMLTDRAYEELAPYKVKRAVILAAGFGSRMVPVTLNTPKPLVRVKGKRIIETLLDAIVEKGIEEIIIVRGYLKEQFEELKSIYPGIRFIDNDAYNEANNISSAYLVKDMLCNAYVLEADLLLGNPGLIREYEYYSNYLGMYKEHTDDWCFGFSGDVITDLMIGGDNCYHMFGISYWDEADGRKMSDSVKKIYEMEGGKKLYWDEVALRYCKEDYEIHVRPCFEGDIVEIDTFRELQEIDPAYMIK